MRDLGIEADGNHKDIIAIIQISCVIRFRVGVRFKGQIACLPCGVLLFSNLRMAICTACWGACAADLNGHP